MGAAMAGVKGRSGGARRGSGRKAKSPIERLVTGSWRPSRHGPPPSTPVMAGAVAPLLFPQPAIPPPPAALLAGLTEPALVFVRGAWEQYASWSPADLVILRQAAEAVDALAEFQTRLAADGRLVTNDRGVLVVHPFLRPQQSTRHVLISLLAQLHLEK